MTTMTATSAAQGCKQCKEYGWFYPSASGERRVCPRHSTAGERDLVRDLDRRSAAFLTKAGQWPYGPNIDVQSRLDLTKWAERLRIKQANTYCRELHWLRQGRCGVQLCTGGLGHWADHVTRWNYAGKPALLVAQPYGISGDDITRLGQLAADDDLSVSVNTYGWYGHGTIMIEVWNSAARRVHGTL